MSENTSSKRPPMVDKEVWKSFSKVCIDLEKTKMQGLEEAIKDWVKKHRTEGNVS